MMTSIFFFFPQSFINIVAFTEQQICGLVQIQGIFRQQINCS